MNRLGVWSCVLLACGSGSSSSQPNRDGSGGRGGTVTSPEAANTKRAPAPTIREEQTARFVRDAATCPQPGGSLSLDCPALRGLSEHAHVMRFSGTVAETCVALLRDANEAVRQATTHCMRYLSPPAIAPYFGAALDALDAEPQPVIRVETARGVTHAHAVTTPFEPRVRATIQRLAKGTTVEDEQTAGALLLTLFPGHVDKGAPEPTVEAQQLVLSLIGRSRGALYETAVDLAHLVVDRTAVCAALRQAIRADNDGWWHAGVELAAIGQPCVADVPHVIEVALARAQAGDPNGNVLLRLDRTFGLDPTQRRRIATTLKAAESNSLPWKRPDVIEAMAAFGSAADTP